MSHILTCLALRALSRKGTVASCRQEAKISMAIVFCTCIQQGLVRSHQKCQAFGAQIFSRLQNQSWDRKLEILFREDVHRLHVSYLKNVYQTLQTIFVIWLQKPCNRSLEILEGLYIHLYRVRQELVFIMLNSIISLKTQRLQSIQLLKNLLCMELPWWSWIIPSWAWCGEGAAFLGGGGLPIHPRRLFLWISRGWRMIWRSPIGNSYTLIWISWKQHPESDHEEVPKFQKSMSM